MKKGIGLAESLLTAILNFLPALCVQLGVLAMFEMQVLPWRAFFFALLPVCVLVTGRRTKRPAVFFGVTAGAALLLWVLSASTVQKVVYLAALAVCAVTVILKRMDLFLEGDWAPMNGTEKAGLPIVTYVVLLVSSFVVRGQGGTQGASGFVLAAYQVLAVAAALLYYLYLFVSGFHHCMATDKGAAVQQKQVFFAGGFLNLTFGAAAAVLLFFSTQLSLPGKLFSGAKGLLYNFMKWLVSLIPESHIEQGGALPDASMEEAGAAVTGTMPGWLEAVLSFSVRLVIAATWLLALYLLFRLLRLILRAFVGRNVQKAGQDSTFLQDETEDLRRENRKARENALPFFARTPEQKIRKTYYKVMTETGKRGRKEREEERAAFREALQGGTVRELAAYFPGEAYEQLAALYEKARYSGQSCVAEDVAAARQAARKLKQEWERGRA